jgi:molybdenum cofactor biosynthesis enzyme MoaA
MQKDSECGVYQVRIRGDVNRDFFVEITASQNTRKDVLEGIKQWCDSHFDKLPIDGKSIQVNLDEIRKN